MLALTTNGRQPVAAMGRTTLDEEHGAPQRVLSCIRAGAVEADYCLSSLTLQDEEVDA